MEVVVAVVVAALLSSMVVAVAAERPGAAEPLDTDTTERALVRYVRAHPLLRGLVRERLSTAGAGVLLVAIAFALTALVAVVLGLLLRAADGSGTFASWDESLSSWGVRHADGRAVDVLRALTQLGGTPVLALVLVVVGTLDVARRRNADVAVFLLVVGVGQNLLSNGIKLLVDRDRPDVLQLVGAHGSSFPSGHSTAAAACWAALALVLTRRATRPWRIAGAAAAALLAMAVAASRSLLGVHWATDVIGGLALGWAWFTFVAVAFGGRRQRLGEPGERVGTASR